MHGRNLVRVYKRRVAGTNHSHHQKPNQEMTSSLDNSRVGETQLRIRRWIIDRWQRLGAKARSCGSRITLTTGLRLANTWSSACVWLLPKSGTSAPSNMAILFDSTS